MDRPQGLAQPVFKVECHSWNITARITGHFSLTFYGSGSAIFEYNEAFGFWLPGPWKYSSTG
jgi:hypothetical protein